MNTKSKLMAEASRTSTPLRPNTKMYTFTNGIREFSPVGQVVAVEKKKKLIVLIAEAIKAVGDPRKGASYQAIKNWIINSQGKETAKNYDRMLKLAVIKGLSTGELIRPSHCLTAVGLTGSFKLPKEVSKKPPKKTVKPTGGTNSPPKVKKQTQEKKPNTKKAAEVVGQKAPVKLAVAPIKQNLNFSNSESDANNEKVSTEVEKKPLIKTASKQATKQIPKKEKPAAKTVQSKTVTKQSTRVKKGENVEKNSKDNAEKGKKTKSSKEGENVEETTKSKKQLKMKAGPSGQSDVTKKEISKTVDGKTSKAAGTKKLYTSKNVSNQKRKDFSDTELDTNNHRPIPLKSYSSDTELEISKRKSLTSKKNTKTRERKIPVKKETARKQ